jgi:uncharacterized protein YbjT (DUF2867 family)
MKPDILITGATGNTGSLLADHLAARGKSFRVLVHTPSKADQVRKGKTEAVIGDFSDPASLERALEGIERAYLVSPASPDMAKQQKAFVAAAKKTGLKRIVKLGALGTASNSPVGLLRQHAEIEEHIKKSGIAYTLLRPHFFMENLLNNIGTIKSDSAIYSPLGDARISAVSTADIAAVALKTLIEEGHAGKVYILTGPEAVSYGKIAEVVGEVIGKKIAYIPVSYDTAQQTMLKSGMPDWLVNDLIRLMKTWSKGEGEPVSADVEKILNRKPISLKEFFFRHKRAIMNPAEHAA